MPFCFIKNWLVSGWGLAQDIPSLQVTLVACMPKLLTILNAMIRSKTVWRLNSIFQNVAVEAGQVGRVETNRTYKSGVDKL